VAFIGSNFLGTSAQFLDLYCPRRRRRKRRRGQRC
jgi:hypothetical protein